MVQATNGASTPAAMADLRAVALRFQQAIPRTAVTQLGSTLVPLVALLTAMHLSLAVGWWWLVPMLALPAAGMVVRTFIIQHDCGHGSFLSSRRANDVLGHLCSLFTLTPYAHWRRQHAQHHGTWNDLDRREGRGSDIYSTCLTVAEYNALGPWQRRWHRLLNHPLVALLVLPPIVFLIVYRLPFDTPATWVNERRNVHLTNFAILALYGGLGFLVGFWPVALVLLAVMVPASIAGVWLFSLQHRFDGASWARHDEWDAVTAAIEGSSLLRLPRLLQWFTGSIGFHHIHHLAPRVPNYRLEECHLAHPAFASVHVLTLKDGLRAFRYALWDEEANRMTTFQEADARVPVLSPAPRGPSLDPPERVHATTALSALPTPGEHGYALAYAEYPERPSDAGGSSAARPMQRMEYFRTAEDAMGRAREIIGASHVWAVEMHAMSGALILSPPELALLLGCPLPPHEPGS